MPSRDSNGRFVSGGGSAHVKDVDRGYADLMKRVKQRAVHLTVGIHEDVGAQRHDDEGSNNATIAEIATWLEMGTSRSPARSFVADWEDENSEVHKELVRKIALGVVNGKISSNEEGFRLLGEKLKMSMVRRMGDGIPPENAASTIARKGSSTPGIDTGKLRQKIDFKVTSQ